MKLTRGERQLVLQQCKDEGHDWRNDGIYSKCRRCGKVKRSPAPIQLKQVMPDTGEIIERKVSQHHFKPERDSTLSRDFSAKILAGDRPGLIFPGDEDCPLTPGQEFDVTSNVSIVINRVTKTKGGDHRCRYVVKDFRETLIRRTPKMHEPPERDQHGYPIPHTKEAIAAATIDGNYTQDPRQAVPSTGPEVDIEYRRVLGVRKRKAVMDSEAEHEAQRKRERALRDELRATLKRLEPQAAAELLAGVERLCTEAKDTSAAIV